MLSLFPQILFLAPFSALLIRLTLAIMFALAAYRHATREDSGVRFWAGIEAALAAALIAGAWTQAVALVALIASIVGLIVPSMRAFPKSTMLLVLVLCISLVVTGAGALAFDLPL